MALLLGLALIFSAHGKSDAQTCYFRPAWMMSGDEYWEGIPSSAELPERNKIKVLRAGTMLWNGYRVSAKELDTLLRRVRQARPQPLTQFEWEEGAPCASIEKVRKLMKEHLKCVGTKNCLEGADPRWPAPPHL